MAGNQVVPWNRDKPHRCPECHAVAIGMERPSRRKVYTCCQCGVRFARWPRLAAVLGEAGVRCSGHMLTQMLISMRDGKEGGDG